MYTKNTENSLICKENYTARFKSRKETEQKIINASYFKLSVSFDIISIVFNMKNNRT